MPKIPAVNARKVRQVLELAGFRYLRNHGSHAIYINDVTRKTTAVPDACGKDIKKGTLHDIIKQSGLTGDEFLKLLRKKK